MADSGVERTPGVCGGDPCIVRTRIPVWVLVQSRRLGMSEADILKSYPTLLRRETSPMPGPTRNCTGRRSTNRSRRMETVWRAERQRSLAEAKTKRD